MLVIDGDVTCVARYILYTFKTILMNIQFLPVAIKFYTFLL